MVCINSMNILAIESSTEQGTLAFFEQGQRLWGAKVESGRNHNTEVLVELEQKFAEFEQRPDLILVGAGPGNYTGVRVAISIAQGVEVVLGARAVVVPSFLSVCEEVSQPVIFGNARRSEFFQTSVNENYEMAEITIMSLEETSVFSKQYVGKPLVCFEQSEVIERQIEGSEIIYHQPEAQKLISTWLKMSDEQRAYYQKQSMEPVYLRPPNMQKSSKNHPLLSL